MEFMLILCVCGIIDMPARFNFIEFQNYIFDSLLLFTLTSCVS